MGCKSDESSTAQRSDSVPSSAIQADSRGQTQTGGLGVGVSASYAELSLDEWWLLSDFIVAATYSGAGEPMLIEPVGEGSPMYFTEYEFTVDEVFYEDPSSPGYPHAVGSSIHVRSMGGAGASYAVNNGNAPQLEEGTSYLLFLYFIPDGASYNTEGEHFYLKQDGSGAWTADGDAYTSGAQLAVTADQLHGYEDVSPHMNTGGVVRATDGRDAFLEETAAMLKSGQITQEQYDQTVARIEAERNSFAHVMTPEEVEEFEREESARQG